MSPVDQLKFISTAAVGRLNETFDAPDVIPFGVAAVELIISNPNFRQDFAKAFVDGINNPSGWDPWFIAFCMHSLRWPELKSVYESMSRQAIADDDWRAIPVLGHVLDAFEDNWEDASTIYSSYFGSKQRT